MSIAPTLRRRPFLALSASGLALAALTGAALADDRPTINVAVQMLTTSNTLEPLNEVSNVGARTFHALYDNLIEFDWSGAGGFKPGLATEWARIDDRTVELTLRRGVRFHNGDEMTADDVAFTFGAARMFGEDAPQREAARRIWPTLDRVEIIDDHTVRFVTSEPDVNIENRLAMYGSQIMSRRAFEEAGSWEDWSRATVGTGPYRLERFSPDNELVMVAHDDYWQGTPPIAELRWVEVPETATRVAGLMAGDFDFATDVPPDRLAEIEAAPGIRVAGGPITNVRILTFDKNNAVLADPRIRQALNLAIDRALIVEALWGGRTQVPNGLQFADFGPLHIDEFGGVPFDPDRARALLDEAGYDGAPIEYRVLDDYYTNELATAQVLVEMWRDVGLNVTLSVRENWGQIVEPGPDRAIRNWSNTAHFNDPAATLARQMGPDGGQQVQGYWTNPEFNEAVGQLLGSADRDERRAAHARMLEIWHDEDPGGTVLHQNAIFYGVRDGIVWDHLPNQYMDFRPGAFGLLESN